MKQEVKVEYILETPLKINHKEVWEFRKNYCPKGIRRVRTIQFAADILAGILLWNLYGSMKDENLFENIIIRKEVFFGVWIIFSLVHAFVSIKVVSYLQCRKLRRKYKKANRAIKLIMIFNSSEIKVVSEDSKSVSVDSKSVSVDYGYLYEQATEFVFSGIIHLYKKELGSEEVEFLSEMCKKYQLHNKNQPRGTFDEDSNM